MANTRAVGVGIADVFTCQDQHSSRDELHVLAAFDHSGEIIQRRVGVASSKRFNERRDDVVMLFATLVVNGDVFLCDVDHQVVGNIDIARCRLADKVYEVQKFSRVTTRDVE